MAELDILVTSAPVITAPAAVWLEAIDLSGFDVGGPGPGEIYDPSFHEITYIWTVQGAPLAPYNAPENMVPGWNNPNVTYGKRAAFCFPDPGTYTIVLWAVDASGTTGTTRTTIVVVPADSLYPGDQTIVHASDGNFLGAPSGAVQVSSLSALQSAIQATSLPTRVLFKRGETVLDVNLISRPSGSSTGRMDHVGAWGTGAAPVLRPLPFDTGNMITWRSSGPETQITVESVKIKGYWDPDTETGSLGGGSPLQWRDKNTSAKILLWNIEITNFDAQQLSANKAPCDVMVADCDIRNWQQYGFYCGENSEGKFAFLGCRVTQSPNALNGGPKKGLSNNHGPIRITSCKWIVGDLCDLFSNNGWSGKYDCQPCLRIATSPEGTTGTTMNWCRSVMENGYQIINLEGENETSEDNPGNFVFDQLLLLGTTRQRAKGVSIQKGGTTLRNIYYFQPDAPRYIGGPSNFFDFTANNPNGTNNNEPIRLYNCTAVSLISAANEGSGGPMNLVDGTGSFADVTIENNIVHIPNGSLPVTASGPLDLSATVPNVTPRYKGVQYNYEHVRGTLDASIPNGGDLSVPYSNLLVRDHNEQGPGTATNQAYWQAIEAIDTLHMLSLNGDVKHAANGDFRVSFGSLGVTITNTSGSSWNVGMKWWLALDRKTRREVELPLQTQFASPPEVPVAKPGIGSPAYQSADRGLVTYMDFFGDIRPTQASMGAIEP